MENFRKMRRNGKQLSEQDAYKVLKKCNYIILSTKLENGYPYSVPLNHVYENGRIYFHCALEGQKVDAFRYDDKVCISAVEKGDIIPEKFSTAFTSITAFGRISLVEDEEERMTGFTSLIKRFSPEFYESGIKYIEKLKHKTALYAVDIEHITGKSSIKMYS